MTNKFQKNYDGGKKYFKITENKCCIFDSINQFFVAIFRDTSNLRVVIGALDLNDPYNMKYNVKNVFKYDYDA